MRKTSLISCLLTLIWPLADCAARGAVANLPPAPRVSITVSRANKDAAPMAVMLARFPARFWVGDAAHPACADSFDVREPASDRAWLDAVQEAGGDDAASTMGKCFFDRHLILVRVNRYCPPDAILAHELGHVVWADYLGDAERAQWERIYDADLRAGRSCSRYARTDAEEGFCEAVRCYLGRGLGRDMDGQRAFLDGLWGDAIDNLTRHSQVKKGGIMLKNTWSWWVKAVWWPLVGNRVAAVDIFLRGHGRAWRARLKELKAEGVGDNIEGFGHLISVGVGIAVMTLPAHEKLADNLTAWYLDRWYPHLWHGLALHQGVGLALLMGGLAGVVVIIEWPVNLKKGTSLLSLPASEWDAKNLRTLLGFRWAGSMAAMFYWLISVIFALLTHVHSDLGVVAVAFFLVYFGLYLWAARQYARGEHVIRKQRRAAILAREQSSAGRRNAASV